MSDATDVSATLAGAPAPDPVSKDVAAAVTPAAIAEPKTFKAPSAQSGYAGIMKRQNELATQQKADYERMNKEKPTTPKLEPWTQKPPEVDPARAFGSAASILGILGGLLTRSPLTTALNASAAAQTAIRQNDLAKYEDAKKTFKENTEIAIQNAEAQHRDFAEAYGMMKDGYAAGWAAVKQQAALHGDMWHMHNDDVRLGMQLNDSARNARVQTEQESDRHLAALDASMDRKRPIIEATEALKKENPAFDKMSPDQQNAAVSTKLRQIEIDTKRQEAEFSASANKLSPVKVDGVTQYLTQGQIAAAQGSGAKIEPVERASGGMSGQEAKVVDEMVSKGTPRAEALQTVHDLMAPTPRSPTAMLLAQWKKENPNSTAAEQTASYGEIGTQLKARKDFGTGPLGQQVASFSKATSHLDLAESLVKALDSGDVQTINRLKARWNTAFGEPLPTEINAAKNIIGDEIAKSIVGSASALADRQAAQGIIDTGNSLRQNLGSIKVVRALMVGQLKEMERMYVRVTHNHDFRSEGDGAFLSPEALRELNKSDPKGAAASGLPSGWSVQVR